MLGDAVQKIFGVDFFELEDDAEFPEAPSVVALVGIVILEIAIGLPYDARLPVPHVAVFLAFDLQEEVERRSVRVGEGEVRIGVKLPRHVLLLPDEGQVGVFAVAGEPDMVIGYIQLVVNGMP